MRHFRIFLIILGISLLLPGCGKKHDFIIQGQIEGIGMRTVTATYYSGGGLKRVSTMAMDNKFALKGEAPRPTLVTLALSDGTPLATLIAENGDKLTVTGDLAAPLAIKSEGNSESEDISEWVNDNASVIQSRNAEAINKAVAEWVGKHRSSKASTALMVTYFQTPGYERLADSLMTLLSSGARAPEVVQNFTGVLSSQLGEAASMEVPGLYLYDSTDSVINFNPHQSKALLLCFMNDSRTARDSVGAQIRRLMASYPDARFKAVEISTAADSASWRNSIAGDSATWRLTWAPGTIASASIRKLAIPRMPFFIVADSAGTQIYRGASITAAAAVIDKKFK